MTIERPTNITTRPSSEWLHRFAILVAVSVVALVTVGALVTSTKSGDAIPDWPTSYGALIPKQLVGGILYEWSHRAVAGAVALLVLALALWLTFSPVPRWVKMLGWFAVTAVVAQAILGGLRVLVVSHEKVQATALAVINFQHPDAVRIAFAVAHATLAQIVLGLTFAIALFTKPIDKGVFWASSKSLPFSLTRPTALSLLLLALVFLQLLLGSIVRHTDSGLIIPDFPTSFGKIIPPFGDLPFDPNNPQRMSYGEFAFKVTIHFAHRVNGFLIAALIFLMLWKLTSNERVQQPLKRLMLWNSALVIVQVFLGGLTIWTGLAVPVTVAHVALGATLLGLSVLTFCYTAFVSGEKEQAQKPAGKVDGQ